MAYHLSLLIALWVLAPYRLAFAGAQQYEPLAANVQAALSRNISDRAPPISSFRNTEEESRWLANMASRLEKKLPDHNARIDLLRSVHYEAIRAGLDPQMVLGLIDVESGFRKYAISSSGARGFMQVMPFWKDLIGQPDNNLFHMRTNLRYGCTILRHYLDLESGNVVKALARYNGSIGRTDYPKAVRQAWEHRWLYEAPHVQAR